jgi:general secretion pathway protein E/type IV pilus assembly protein PilB
MTQPRDRRWLADVVVASGHLPRSAVPAVLARCTIEEAWSEVCAAAAISPEQLAELLAKAFGLPLADFRDVDPAAAALLPAEAHRDRLLRALRRTDAGLEVAVADPTDVELERVLHFMTDLPAILSIATPATLREQPTLDMPDTETRPEDGIDIDSATGTESAIVRLCNRLFRQAVDRGASDIHVQPHGAGGVIRMRIDGVLRRVATLQHSVMLRLVSRIKLVATMDPTDRLRPQDGRLRLRLGGRTHDVRVSTVPANGEEKLVARILGGSAAPSLHEVGIGHPELEQLSGLLSRSHGIVLVTGPTGSGKTTTLYSALAERNDPSVNISTVEDPVEIRLPWLTQIEVNPKADLTFASALRSVLRQDPDVVLIGEIRDPETAQIAVQAAITGHLVLASLHTNDAVTTVPRLLDLGVTPQLMGEAVAGASAQRLVRRLCPACARPVTTSSGGAQWLAKHAGIPRLMGAKGCVECSDTGYRGRLPICQVLEFTRDMAELVEQEKSLQQLRAMAKQGGMRTLAESAADRLRAGETSLEEALRELGSGFWLELGVAYGVPPFRDSFVPRKTEDDESHDAPVLLISPDATQLQMAGNAFRKAGFQVLEAEDARKGRDLLTRDGAAMAILTDLTRLPAAQARALLALRETIGGAAIPIIGLRGDNAAVDPALTNHPGVILRNRPSSYALLPVLLRDAMATFDRDVGAALDRGE